MMRNRFYRFILVATALFACSAMLAAQTDSAGPPEKMAGPHDLTGVWDAGPTFRTDRAYFGTFPGKPSMTPWAQAQFDKAKPTFGPASVPVSLTNDPVYQCFPPGTPRIFFHPFPMEILQVPGRVIMYFEYDHIVRQIWLNRTKHPDNMIPTYMGDSIGHWDGDTLVVDTIGFNGKTWVDREGHPSSDQLHVVERIRRTGQNSLEDEIVITDPKAYTQPWGGTFLFQRHPNWHIEEFACEDNVSFLKFEKEEVTPQKDSTK
jgi:hypothetical protein